MPDDRTPRSIFAGLAKPEPKDVPSLPEYQFSLTEITAELAYVTQAMAAATEDTFEGTLESISPRLEPLYAAAGQAVSERLAALPADFNAHTVAEAISAVVVRGEVQRFLTIYSLDPVALSPAAMQARAEAELADEDETDESEDK